jgi:GAF domain-containing protein
VAANPQNTMLQDRPVLDEATFQQLLAAAFVLQEHNDRMRSKAQKPQAAPPAPPAPPVNSDYSQTLSEIVETQALIHTHQLDLQSALLLIAQRVQAMTNASAAVVGTIEENQVCYRAACGKANFESGFRIPVDLSLSAECIRTGHIVRCEDAEQDPIVPSDICRKTGAKSFVAVPIHHENRVTGILEVRFPVPNGFQERDVRTCQLMAGLAAEAISHAAELEWKRALAAERANMMEVLEKLRPQLDRLAKEAGQTARQQEKLEPEAAPQQMEAVLTARQQDQDKVDPDATTKQMEAVLTCRGCGESLTPEEAFCGNCGTRVARGGDIQSKWASMWHLKEAADRKKNGLASASENTSVPESQPAATAIVWSSLKVESADSVAMTVVTPDAIDDALAGTGSPWTSASHARRWLESMKSEGVSKIRLTKIWTTHRSHFYVAISALLLLVVIAGWGGQGSWDGTASASSIAQHRQHPPKPRLTLFEQTLVALGIAEAPPAPQYYKGNPNTAVWEDIHTATYYCPGSDLYGKTDGGKYATQREAQQDQFEPASRKVCK